MLMISLHWFRCRGVTLIFSCDRSKQESLLSARGWWNWCRSSSLKCIIYLYDITWIILVTMRHTDKQISKANNQIFFKNHPGDFVSMKSPTQQNSAGLEMFDKGGEKNTLFIGKRCEWQGIETECPEDFSGTLKKLFSPWNMIQHSQKPVDKVTKLHLGAIRSE